MKIILISILTNHEFEFEFEFEFEEKKETMASRPFAEISDQEIENLTEKAIPDKTKTATKYGLKIFNGKIHICYSPAGRSVLGKTVPEVLDTARGRRPRAVLKTEGIVFPNMDRPRLVNNIFIFFSNRTKDPNILGL